MGIKVIPSLIAFTVIFSSASLFAQDFIFTSSKSKLTGQPFYSAEVDDAGFISRLSTGMTFSMKLNGSIFTKKVKRISRLSNGYTGVTFQSVAGSPVSSNLLIKDGHITGIIHLDDKHYRLGFQNNTYLFFEITDEVHQCGGDIVIEDPRSKTPEAGGEYAIPGYDLDQFADTTTVDVLLLYTTNARIWAENSSSVTDIDEILAYSEMFRDEIIENSQLALKIRFVAFLEIDNDTSVSTFAKLINMRENTYTGSTADTVDIHKLRDQFGADLVALVDSIEDTGGRGYRPNAIGASEEGAYSVNRVQQLNSSYTLMHEIGHNFGNAHGRTQQTSAAEEYGGIFHYSTGHYLTGNDGEDYATVMHYTNINSGDGYAANIPYYSNPRISYLSSPTGSYTGEGGPSDNVLSMSITKSWLADYRETVQDPPEISLSTSAVTDTVLPSGITTRQFVIENTGDSDLEVKLDGKMEFSSSLKAITNSKQPLDIFYGFESSEGYSAGTYLGYNNWIGLEEGEPFEISDAYSYSGTHSLKIPSYYGSTAWFQSPFFATSSRYSSYHISMKLYSDGGFVRSFVSFENALSEDESAGFQLSTPEDVNTGSIGFYGMLSDKTYWTYSSDDQLTDEWVDLDIDISADNGGTVSYTYGSESRSFTGNGFLHPQGIQFQQNSNSEHDLYVDDIQITATDLYGPALAISDKQITIRPGETDTVEIAFYGNDNPEGIYSGTIYLETNDPANTSLTIPSTLRIDPEYNITSGDFSVELTGQAGFRMLASPVETTIKNFLEPIYTQGAANSDTTGEGLDTNVWLWDNTFSGSSSAGWLPVSDLNQSISPGEAILVYVFEQDDLSNPESTDFPKLLSVSGDLVSGVSPEINDNTNGFSFVGNPFASTISWDNLDATDLKDVVYAWDPNDEVWKSYNGAGDLTEGLLKPFQGFIVQAANSISTGTSLSIDSDDITSGGTFIGKEVADQYIRFEARDPNSSTYNSSYIIFNKQARLGEDNFDALEMTSLSANFIELSGKSEEGLNLDLNTIPEISDKETIRLNLNSDYLSHVDFSITDMAGMNNFDVFLLEGDQKIKLIPGNSVKLELKEIPQQKVTPVSALPMISSGDDNIFEILIENRNGTSAEPETPVHFQLAQNYPNPFNPETTIEFGLPSAQVVRLTIYNILGQPVQELINRPMEAGFHVTRFDASHLASGTYIYRIEAGEFIQTRKMLLIK